MKVTYHRVPFNALDPRNEAKLGNPRLVETYPAGIG